MSERRDARTFPVVLGRVMITANALAKLTVGDVLCAIRRHIRGDWGDTLCDEDRRLNDQALLNGGRLLSCFRASAGVKF